VGAGQGVSLTRDITHTHVPTFFDARGATFTCDDGSSFDDPLVVISAGDGAGGSNEVNLAIAPDGSFSYNGAANWSKGSGTMTLQGRFSGDVATGTVQWTAKRDNCSGSAGPAQWTAHCVEQCGGSSTGSISVAVNGRAVIGQWTLVDVTVNSDGAARIAAFAHHDGSRACGSFTDEEAVAVQRGRHGPVERLGEAQVPGPGRFVFHGKYIPDQFGRSDRICAYLTQAPAGDTVLAQGQGSPKIAFGLPWAGGWSNPKSAARVTNLYSFGTPYRAAPSGTARGLYVIGTWGCDGGLQRSNKLAARRWWLGASTLTKAIKLMPIRVRPNGSFTFAGAAHPDFSSNYDAPVPKKWPARSMRVTLTGRLKAGHDEDGAGVVRSGAVKVTVVNGSHRCSTNEKLNGGGALSELSRSVDERYSGTLTSG
jgi:hypothetical protein